VGRGVRVKVGVGVRVGVQVEVGVGVRDGVDVRVGSGVRVGVAVAVLVKLGVGVNVFVGVLVGSSVRVGVTLGCGVRVADGDGAVDVSTTTVTEIDEVGLSVFPAADVDFVSVPTDGCSVGSSDCSWVDSASA
jgi:hypothetical protein